MTCLVNATKYPTKKSLKEAHAAGNDIYIEDPSIFNPHSGYLSVLAAQGHLSGLGIVVTTMPKRKWFASIKLVKDKIVIS